MSIIFVESFESRKGEFTDLQKMAARLRTGVSPAQIAIGNHPWSTDVHCPLVHVLVTSPQNQIDEATLWRALPTPRTGC